MQHSSRSLLSAQLDLLSRDQWQCSDKNNWKLNEFFSRRNGNFCQPYGWRSLVHKNSWIWKLQFISYQASDSNAQFSFLSSCWPGARDSTAKVITREIQIKLSGETRKKLIFMTFYLINEGARKQCSAWRKWQFDYRWISLRWMDKKKHNAQCISVE